MQSLSWHVFAAQILPLEMCSSNFTTLNWLLIFTTQFKLFNNMFRPGLGLFLQESIFFMWSPLMRRHLFQPPSMVFISVIIHVTHYKLQILNGPLCAVSMCWFVHLFLDMWGLIFAVLLCSITINAGYAWSTIPNSRVEIISTLTGIWTWDHPLRRRKSWCLTHSATVPLLYITLVLILVNLTSEKLTCNL